MPLEVRLSQLQSRQEYEVAVATYIERLHAFAKEVGKPRPVAHPLIEGAVKRVQVKGKPDQYVTDYVIVDDTPAEVPSMSLDDQKNVLRAALTVAENEAKFRILPRGKIRLAQVKMQLASSTPEDKRTAEQNEDIASFLHVQKVWQGIDLIGAQAESDIEDLDESTIDSWQPPKFG